MPKEIKLPAIHANEGLSVEFQRRLDALLDEMDRSITYWLTAAYRANRPEIAQDASPAVELSAIMKRLARKWNKKFADSAPDMAKYFTTAIKDRTDHSLQSALKKSGFSVEFKITREINDILQAAVAENVSLIKTIASEHLADVEQMTMRSVTAGRDLGGLQKALQARYGITKRRAKLIARQGNNNATAMLKRAREIELGVTESVWHHSHAGRVPRPEHEAWGREQKRYDIKTGMWSEVDQQFIWPGTVYNCRCSGRSLLPALNKKAKK